MSPAGTRSTSYPPSTASPQAHKQALLLRLGLVAFLYGMGLVLSFRAAQQEVGVLLMLSLFSFGPHYLAALLLAAPPSPTLSRQSVRMICMLVLVVGACTALWPFLPKIATLPEHLDWILCRWLLDSVGALLAVLLFPLLILCACLDLLLLLASRVLGVYVLMAVPAVCAVVGWALHLAAITASGLLFRGSTRRSA